MRWRGQRESDNIQDVRGKRVSRAGLGLGTVALLMVGTYLLGGDPINTFTTLNRAGYVNMNPSMAQSGASVGSQGFDNGNIDGVGNEGKKFVSVVLASTEDFWKKMLGNGYRDPKLVLFSEAVNSACGYTSAASGPFYCPGDNKLYIDLSFFHELRKLGASGDFAAAYVVAHEVGHHVQTLMGVSNKVRQMQARASKTQGNAIQVRMELQADCYAGAWAANSGMLEQGDVEEGLMAAASVGDDHIMRSAGRRINPESFTHGSSEQRKEWFIRGFKAKSLEQCNTFG